MWTETTRPKYERGGLRFASDLTAEEWGVIGPLLPSRKRLGRPRTTEIARGAECDPLHGAHGLPVADVAQGFSPAQHGSRIFLRVARGRDIEPDQSRTAHAGA